MLSETYLQLVGGMYTKSQKYIIFSECPFQLLLNAVTPSGTNSPLTSASTTLLSSYGPLYLNEPEKKRRSNEHLNNPISMDLPQVSY